MDTKEDPELEQEWVRQNNLIYGGLIGIGVVMVQPFLTASSLDLTAKVCVIAFAVSIPLLAALVMVDQQGVFRRRATTSRIVAIAKPVAQMCAFVGVVAGFWHSLRSRRDLTRSVSPVSARCGPWASARTRSARRLPEPDQRLLSVPGVAEVLAASLVASS